MCTHTVTFNLDFVKYSASDEYWINSCVHTYNIEGMHVGTYVRRYHKHTLYHILYSCRPGKHISILVKGVGI